MTCLNDNGPNSPTIEVELDYTNDPTSGTTTWTDITPYVVSYKRDLVRTNEFDQPGPAGATLVLRNDDGRFIPDNTSGPYTGGLKKYRRVRVRCQWAGVTYNRYFGYVLDWPQSWGSKGYDQTVTLPLQDALLPLESFDLGVFVRAVDTAIEMTGRKSGAVISNIVAVANSPASGGTIDAGSSVVWGFRTFTIPNLTPGATAVPLQTWALQHLKDV